MQYHLKLLLHTYKLLYRILLLHLVLVLSLIHIFLDFVEYLCIGNGSLYFQAVAYNMGIVPQCFQLFLIISTNLLHIKAIKGLSLIHI